VSQSWAKGSDTRWRTLRAYVLQRDNHLCRIGGPKCISTATHVDHIVPLEMGGEKYSETNCRAACEPCNTGRRVRVAAYEPEPRPVSHW
jgi:5-methylcytosine-specific restriction endonuclease McrA